MVAYSFKKRFVPAVLLGLKPSPGADTVRPKRQTIRAGSVSGGGTASTTNGKRHARPGEVVQLYTAMRTKQCRKLGEARCVSVQPITLWLGGDGAVTVQLGGKLLGLRQTRQFVRDDGFETPQDMVEFWQQENGADKFGAKWHGVLITWEPLP